VTAFEQQDCRHENSSPSAGSHRPLGLRRLPLPIRRHRAGGALVPMWRSRAAGATSTARSTGPARSSTCW